MTDAIRAYAATSNKGPLKPFEYQPGPLLPDQVEIRVESCGLCHSDQSMIRNEFGITTYPLVPGHEVIGTIVAVGERVTARKAGERAGLGWLSGSCLACPQCLAGNHNLCVKVETTIMGRHGGFAERVRAHWIWAAPIPAGIDLPSAGPLFCGGSTVFNPIQQFNIRPTDRVAVIGIGGLGHMALKFLNACGCEVTAFSSSAGKSEEIKQLGAHHILNSRDPEAMKQVAGRFDFVLSTASANLDWGAILSTLAPKGRLHFVGIVPDPVPVAVLSLIGYQRSVSGSPIGSPANTQLMLEFAARHKIAPQVEEFPMSKINDALAHLEAGKARYRVVLKADF